MSQRRHTVVIKIEQRKIRRDLILEDPLFGRDIFIQRLIPVLVIDRHVEQGGNPGLESIDRLELETGDLDDEIVERTRLPCLVGAQVFHRRFAQGRAQISADERPLAALREKLADQRHGRALAVRPSDGKERASEELRGKLQFADHLYAAPTDRFEWGEPIGHSGADHDQVRSVE